VNALIVDIDTEVSIHSFSTSLSRLRETSNRGQWYRADHLL